MTDLARCSKCAAYVFRAPDDVIGGVLAVDVVPVAREAYIAALVAGTATYDAVERPGRPLRLRLRGLRSPAPTYDENGAQAGTQRVLVQHGCSGASYALAVKPAADTGKAPAPATHGRGSAGSRPPVARVAGDGRSSVARHVIHRPGDVFRGGSNATLNPPKPKIFAPVRCNTCDKLIDQTKPFAGIQHGRWVWAVHEECE